MLYEGVNIGEKDFSALVSKIKAAGADLVYWGGLHTEGGLIVRQMRDQGLRPSMMCGDGITADEFASIGGPGVEGTLMTFAPDPRKTPRRRRSWRSSAGQEVRAGGLHALQLRGGADHQAGGRAGEVARPEEGRRGDQVRQDVQDRDRRLSYDKKGDITPAPGFT